MMVYKVVCHNCGYVFYKDKKIPNLLEIYGSVGGVCPRCGRKINWKPKAVIIKKAKKNASQMTVTVLVRKDISHRELYEEHHIHV